MLVWVRTEDGDSWRSNILLYPQQRQWGFSVSTGTSPSLFLSSPLSRITLGWPPLFLVKNEAAPPSAAPLPPLPPLLIFIAISANGHTHGFFYIGLLHSGPAFAEGGVQSPPSSYIPLPLSSPVSGEDVTPCSLSQRFRNAGMGRCQAGTTFFLQAGGYGDTSSSVRIISMSIRSSALKVALKTRRWCISLQIYADTIHPSDEHMAIRTGACSALWSLPCPTDCQVPYAKTSWDWTLSISSDVRTGDQVRSSYGVSCTLAV